MKPLLLNVAELLRRPATDRDLRTELTAEELGIADHRVAPADVITVAVRLESLSDGIVVTGQVTAPWHDTCRRCLIELDGLVEAPVDELYQSHVTTDTAFPIQFDQMDLAPMARELVMLELPVAPLCREDCAGICPTCGVNRNEQPCSCQRPVTDDRWSALDALRQQLN